MGAETSSTLKAVIDIGSNSVRLVVYAGPARAPTPIVNEKVLCGLGRGLRDNGVMGAEAVASALRTLDRFRRLLAGYPRIQVETVATSAVRDAGNQAEFLAEVRARGFRPRVLSGADEARLAALGVVSAEPRARGLVGDLGGGSLELVKVAPGRPVALGAGASLVLGPLRLGDRPFAKNRAEMRRHIDETLAPAIAENALSSETLYIVGGAWRNLARIELLMKDHPLAMLHNFVVRREDVLSLCDLVATQSQDSLARIPGISRRRLETLPLAALVLERLILAANIRTVFTSAAGLREGLLYDALSEAERALDPLEQGAADFARRLSPNLEFGEAAQSFTADLFADETHEERRLRRAACTLVDIGAFLHPDHRDAQSYTNILYAPFTAIDHPGRAFVALSIFHRYAGRKAAPATGEHARLLSVQTQRRAMLLGLTLRFAASIAPKSAAALRGCAIMRDDEALTLTVSKEARPLLGEVEEKRFGNLAGELGLTPVVETAA